MPFKGPIFVMALALLLSGWTHGDIFSKPWVLQTNFWVDTGVWKDTSVWQD